MKKDLKSMIKKLSDEQEIHDVSNDVLKNVDMNKAFEAMKAAVEETLLFSNLVSAFAAAMLVVLVVVLVNSNNKPEENKPIDNGIIEPGDNVTGETISDATDETSNIVGSLELNVNILKSFLAQDAYNIINIVPSIGKMNFKEVTLNTESKRMTDSEMEALVDDVHSQIYNIEEMLGLTTVECTSDDNQYFEIDESNYADFEKVISVTGPLSKYHLYYTEYDQRGQNIGEANYKSDSNITGMIDTLDATYSFSGSKRFRNNKTTFMTTVQLSDYTIDVKEVFGVDNNEFTYSFYNNDLELIKEIYIKQKLDDNGDVRELTFNNQYTTINIEKKNVNENSPLVFKVDSRDNDTLTITKNETNYTYQFGNNKEIVYTR